MSPRQKGRRLLKGVCGKRFIDTVLVDEIDASAQAAEEVVFYEDAIVAVRLDDGDVYVPIRPICDNLGVTLAGQRERINRDPVLAEMATSVSVTLTQQARGMICLPLKFIPGWETTSSGWRRLKPHWVIRDVMLPQIRRCRLVRGSKAVAIAYGKQTQKNEFGAVYGELYRREGWTSGSH